MIIQYDAINPKTQKEQGYLKEVDEPAFNTYYLTAFKNGDIYNLEVLEELEGYGKLMQNEK